MKVYLIALLGLFGLTSCGSCGNADSVTRNEERSVWHGPDNYNGKWIRSEREYNQYYNNGKTQRVQPNQSQTQRRYNNQTPQSQ